jgi:hypothetical protein
MLISHLMRLRTVFRIYILSTAAATAAPYVMSARVTARRKLIPTNSEPALEIRSGTPIQANVVRCDPGLHRLQRSPL